ncbi:Adenosine deaminase-like protein, partial [Durusdinium trenchii]
MSAWPDVLAQCRALPKVELHAHLHGCIRAETLALALDRSVALQNVPETKAALAAKLEELRTIEKRSLQECFELFDVIHQVVVDSETLAFVTEQVIADFVADGVRYLELRSTPRATAFMTKTEYLDTLLAAVERSEEEHSNRIMVRCLVSLDRGRPVADAWDTRDVLAALPPRQRRWIVGIDVSGNPTKGRAGDLAEVVAELLLTVDGKLTAHCGEVDDPEDVAAILALKPHRLGHALLVPAAFKPLGVVVECCPTSNCKTLSLRSVEEHPLIPEWLEQDQPFVVCSDDTGVFQTTLSRELALVAFHFSLLPAQVLALTLRALEAAFASDVDKLQLAREIS